MKIRWYIGIGLGVFLFWFLFAGLTAQAHTESEIEAWEQEWTEAREMISGPLAPALLIEFDRARYWFEARHQCHYHGICPRVDEDRPYEPKPVSSSPVKANPTTLEAAAKVSEWRPLVSLYFGDAVDRALCLVWHESRGDPTAYNASTASGLFQVKQFWFDAHGGSPFDPENNVRVAAIVRSAQGWTAWSPYNRGLCR